MQRNRYTKWQLALSNVLLIHLAGCNVHEEKHRYTPVLMVNYLRTGKPLSDLTGKGVQDLRYYKNLKSKVKKLLTDLKQYIALSQDDQKSNRRKDYEKAIESNLNIPFLGQYKDKHTGQNILDLILEACCKQRKNNLDEQQGKFIEEMLQRIINGNGHLIYQKNNKDKTVMDRVIQNFDFSNKIFWPFLSSDHINFKDALIIYCRCPDYSKDKKYEKIYKLENLIKDKALVLARDNYNSNDKSILGPILKVLNHVRFNDLYKEPTNQKKDFMYGELIKHISKKYPAAMYEIIFKAYRPVDPNFDCFDMTSELAAYRELKKMVNVYLTSGPKKEKDNIKLMQDIQRNIFTVPNNYANQTNQNKLHEILKGYGDKIRTDLNNEQKQFMENIFDHTINEEGIVMYERYGQPRCRPILAEYRAVLLEYTKLRTMLKFYFTSTLKNEEGITKLRKDIENKALTLAKNCHNETDENPLHSIIKAYPNRMNKQPSECQKAFIDDLVEKVIECNRDLIDKKDQEGNGLIDLLGQYSNFRIEPKGKALVPDYLSQRKNNNTMLDLLKTTLLSSHKFNTRSSLNTKQGECPICSDKKELFETHKNGHYNCHDCLTKWIETSRKDTNEPTCPQCRADIELERIELLKNYKKS